MKKFWPVFTITGIVIITGVLFRVLPLGEAIVCTVGILLYDLGVTMQSKNMKE